MVNDPVEEIGDLIADPKVSSNIKGYPTSSLIEIEIFLKTTKLYNWFMSPCFSFGPFHCIPILRGRPYSIHV